jgi:hypothetical protein
VSAKQIQIDYEVSIHQPKELEGCYFQVILPGQLVQTGGKFSADANGFKPLPAKPQKGFLFSKAAKSFTWTNGLGKGLKITLGSNLAVQFQDSRQWGLPWYELMIWVPNSAKSTKSHLTFKIEPILSNQTVKPFVDRFGQAVSKRWPGKVTDEKELLQDVQKEEIFLKSKTPPARDEFGGWAGSREKYNLQATGFFRTQKIGNRWWLIDPAGNVYFSLASFFIACDTATVINNRDHLFEWLPDIHAEPWNSASWKDSEGDCFSFYSANLIRKFGPKWYEKWVELSKKRWNAWGLNSTSAFSAQLPKIPYTVYLTLVDQAAPTPPGSPMPDVFDPDFPAKLDALCKESHDTGDRKQRRGIYSADTAAIF